jgi:hypothetical protein
MFQLPDFFSIKTIFVIKTLMKQKKTVPLLRNKKAITEFYD